MLKILITLGAVLTAFTVVSCDESEDTVTTEPDNGNGNGREPIPGASISLDRVDGLSGTGSIYADQTITFHFRFTNNTGVPVTGSTNGLKIYSTDGATWSGAAGAFTAAMTDEIYDAGKFINEFGVDGSGVDTLGFGGFAISSAGIPDGFSEILATIEIGPISASHAGKHICIDSTFYPPGGEWLWSVEGVDDGGPSWDGPHCFEITQ